MIAEDTLFRPTLAQSVPLIGAPDAWARGFTGQGQAIGILDTGVDKAHSTFAVNRVVSEACYSHNDPPNSLFTLCPNGATSDTSSGAAAPCSLTITGCDHGTHVAGIAAGNNVTYSGVAKDANIIAIQVFTKVTNSIVCGGPAPCILAFNSDIVSGLDQIMTLSGTMDISSVNLSLGGGSYTTVAACDGDPSNASIKQAVDNLRSVGIATIAAAGNEGSTNSLNTPACLSNVISVGSTTKTDAVSFFSNSASFLDLLAPGQAITSSLPGNTFGGKSGTSMATPHVAGAWAVLKSGKPTATVTEVLNSLKNTGVPIFDSRNGMTFPRIQVDSAMNDLVPPSGVPWYDNNWQYRKQITIDHTKVAATLTDFPVLISITDSNLLASAQADGDDILFTSADGTTKLSHEIESWNDSSGKLVAWVKMPSLSSVDNTNIFMYYGNAAAVNQENVAGTWRSEYKAVYHLHDDSNDSTSNNNDCTNDGSTNTAGRIADAQEFDGVDDILRCGSNGSIDDIWSSGGTMSVWLEADSRGEGNIGRVFHKYVNMDYTAGENAGATRLAFQTQFTGGFGVWRMSSFPITYNNWHLVHQTYNSNSAANDAAFWVNGNSEPVTEPNTPSGTYLGDASNNLNIGNTDNTARTWDGKIDEFRIYDGTLSAGWISTEYNNQNNPSSFYTVGVEEIQ
jgi:subtilisin family serine protease